MALLAPREAESRVLLSAADRSLREELHRVLAEAFPQTEVIELEAALRGGAHKADLIVLAVPGESEAAALCQRVRSEIAEELPILALLAGDDVAAREELL